MKIFPNYILFLMAILFLSACGGDESDPLTEEEKADTTAPVITLAGANPFVLKKDESFKDPGASARDDVNGKVAVKISGKVNTKVIGTYILTYSAHDKKGNKASKKRTVRVTPKVIDYEKPVITLVGKDPIEVEQGTTFKDPGAVAKDNIDGKIKVTVSGRVDTGRLGTYTLTYSATDSSGNTTTKIRHVIVVPASVLHRVNNVSEFRTALENAADNGSNDIIILSKGTYNTTSDGGKTFKYNDNEAFNLTIKAASGLKRGDVILDGGEKHLVLKYANKATNYGDKTRTLRLERLVIRNGKNSETQYASGLYVNHNLELIDCQIVANKTPAGYGAGIYAERDARIENSLIERNISVSSYNGGGVNIGYHATIINSTFSNNESAGSGGAIYAGSATLINSTIKNNRVTYYGGGIFSNNLNCENSVISSNVSDNTGASAIYSNSSTILNHCLIQGNSNKNGTDNPYSVVYSDKALIVSSVFENNKGYLLSTTYDEGILINNTFINNYSDGTSFIRGRFINNVFDAGVNLSNDSKIYNNYIDYFTLNDNNHIVIKKHNIQPSDGALGLSTDLVPLSNSVLVNKGLNFESAVFKSFFAVGEKFNYSDDETMYDRIVKMLQKDYQGKKRIVGGTIDIGANEKQ